MNLQIAVNGEYFDQIKAKTKPFEYRLNNTFWQRRLVGRDYDRLILTRGYPKKGDPDRTLNFPYKGYEMQTISHKHFQNKEEEVFAIIIPHGEETKVSVD